MFTIEIIIVAAIALVVGIIIGALLSRTLSPEEQKSRSLEARLQETEKSLSEYQHQVTEHFADTAKLVNNLTQSYKDVHQHLASNALKLANVDISRQLLTESVDGDADNSEAAITDENIEPPKDWAPKSPGAEGQLSESYGLDEDELINPAEIQSSKKH